VQANFDEMYGVMLNLLDSFYPERTITVTSNDPSHVTPIIKMHLRRKNRLMRAGRVDEAAALAKQIRAAIIRQNTAQLRRVDTRHCIKDAWAKVRQLTGAHKNRSCYSTATKFTAQDLNDHFAAISSDEHYQKTFPKITADSRSCDISELEVFRMLDRMQPTTTGPDLIPSWFLRLGAPVFSAPLAQLFNQSIHSGVVPRQWKSAFITPIPKTAHPANRTFRLQTHLHHL